MHLLNMARSMARRVAKKGFLFATKTCTNDMTDMTPYKKLQKHLKDIKACLSTNFALECIYLSCLCSRHVQLYSESSGSLLVALLPAKLFSNKRPYLSAVSAPLCMTKRSGVWHETLCFSTCLPMSTSISLAKSELAKIIFGMRTTLSM